MENFTISEIMAAVLAVAVAVNTLVTAWEKITAVKKAAQAPNKKQDERLLAMENELESVNTKLANDDKRLRRIDESSRVTQRALLALLDHGLDGNNKEQMQRAKTDLQNHLINQ